MGTSRALTVDLCWFTTITISSRSNIIISEPDDVVNKGFIMGAAIAEKGAISPIRKGFVSAPQHVFLKKVAITSLVADLAVHTLQNFGVY